MALFVVQSFKSFLTDKWTNRYFLEAADLNAAIVGADIIQNAEAQFHKDDVALFQIRVSDTNPATDIFSVAPTLDVGLGGPAVDWLPLFNTVRVDLRVQGFGRPSRKYYRLPINETEHTSTNISSTLATLVQESLVTMIAALSSNDTPLVDPDGQLLTSPTVRLPVQMRQLHRRRRRAPAP